MRTEKVDSSVQIEIFVCPNRRTLAKMPRFSANAVKKGCFWCPWSGCGWGAGSAINNGVADAEFDLRLVVGC